jgi:hypothetical protein
MAWCGGILLDSETALAREGQGRAECKSRRMYRHRKVLRDVKRDDTVEPAGRPTEYLQRFPRGRSNDDDDDCKRGVWVGQGAVILIVIVQLAGRRRVAPALLRFWSSVLYILWTHRGPQAGREEGGASSGGAAGNGGHCGSGYGAPLRVCSGAGCERGETARRGRLRGIGIRRASRPPARGLGGRGGVTVTHLTAREA